MHDTATLERPNRQAIAFEVARTKYECAKAEYDRLWAIHNAAEEADDQDCPRIDVYFDEYKLGMGMKRERVVDALRCYAIRRGEPLDVEATADEFMLYQARHKESRERHRIMELNDQAFAYGKDHYFPAREALMALPATDTEGLLLKMEIAATWCDEPLVDSVFADVRRMLAA